MKDKIEERVTYNEREFLEPQDGLAVIKGKIKLLESNKHIEIEAQLIFSDRKQQINIDFGVLNDENEDEHIDNRRAKVVTLRTIVNTFLDAIESAYNEMENK